MAEPTHLFLGPANRQGDRRSQTSPRVPAEGSCSRRGPLSASVPHWWGCRGWAGAALARRCPWLGTPAPRSQWGPGSGHRAVFSGRTGCPHPGWRKWGRCRSPFSSGWGSAWGWARRTWGCRRSCRGGSRWWSARFPCRSAQAGWPTAASRGPAWRSPGCKAGRAGTCWARALCGGGARVAAAACGAAAGSAPRHTPPAGRGPPPGPAAPPLGAFCAAGKPSFQRPGTSGGLGGSKPRPCRWPPAGAGIPLGLRLCGCWPGKGPAPPPRKAHLGAQKRKSPQIVTMSFRWPVTTCKALAGRQTKF